MNDEAALRDKLRKIEALFAGAGTASETGRSISSGTTCQQGDGK